MKPAEMILLAIVAFLAWETIQPKSAVRVAVASDTSPDAILTGQTAAPVVVADSGGSLPAVIPVGFEKPAEAKAVDDSMLPIYQVLPYAS